MRRIRKCANIIYTLLFMQTTSLNIQFLIKQNYRKSLKILSMNSQLENSLLVNNKVTAQESSRNLKGVANKKLQAFLINHIIRGIDNEVHRKYFEGYEVNHIAELIVQQVVASAIKCSDEVSDCKLVNKLIQRKGDAITKSFIADPSLIARFLNHSISLDTIFENYINHGDFNRQIFEQIQTHHSDIATYKSWDDINISDKKGALQNYATAANSMGEKAWVKAGNEWIESTAMKYCTIDSKDTTVAELNNGIEKIRLLDVGSCYNPFECCSNASAFTVTALDLCPAKESVFLCDFLKVSVGEVGSAMNTRLIQQQKEDCREHTPNFPTKARRIDEDGRRIPMDAEQKVEAVLNSEQEIISLPAGSFDAVAMSLVLSYLPDPAQRREMLCKARALLRPGGMLLVFEKESIFHTGAYFPLFLRNWKVAVESCGFERVTYTPLRTPSVAGDHFRRSHAFAFRAAAAPDRGVQAIRVRREVSPPPASVVSPPRLWIKQDFQRDVSADGHGTAPLRLEDIIVES